MPPLSATAKQAEQNQAHLRQDATNETSLPLLCHPELVSRYFAKYLSELKDIGLD